MNINDNKRCNEDGNDQGLKEICTSFIRNSDENLFYKDITCL